MFGVVFPTQSKPIPPQNTAFPYRQSRKKNAPVSLERHQKIHFVYRKLHSVCSSASLLFAIAPFPPLSLEHAHTNTLLKLSPPLPVSLVVQSNSWRGI